VTQDKFTELARLNLIGYYLKAALEQMALIDHAAQEKVNQVFAGICWEHANLFAGLSDEDKRLAVTCGYAKMD